MRAVLRLLTGAVIVLSILAFLHVRADAGPLAWFRDVSGLSAAAEVAANAADTAENLGFFLAGAASVGLLWLMVRRWKVALAVLALGSVVSSILLAIMAL